MTTRIVSSGVTLSGFTVSGGTVLEVLSGGVAESTTILGGGTEVVSAGGVISAVTISSGGVLSGAGTIASFFDNFDYGEVDGVLVRGVLYIESGGRTRDVRVDLGGNLFVNSGAVASGDEISNGIERVASGGVGNGAVVRKGGQFEVDSGGESSGLVVSSGGLALLYGGGNNTDDVILSGGSVDYGGLIDRSLTLSWPTTNKLVLDGVTLSKGAKLALFGATILGGATVSLATSVAQTVTVDFGATIVGPGNLEYSNTDYGLVSGVSLFGSGRLYVMSGGSARDVTLDPFSHEIISAGGVAIGGKVGYGAIEVVRGSTSDANVGSQGLIRVLAGGLASGSIIGSGGLELVSKGGRAKGSLISGGQAFIDARGRASESVIESSGVEHVLGTSVDAAVGNGGVEYVSAGGLAAGAVVASGGLQAVLGGGVASGTQVQSDGSETVSSGGVTAAATVWFGGRLVVHSAGAVSGGLTLHGGSAIISGQMASGQLVRFAGSGGVLRLDDLADFGAAISGFGPASGKIDIDGFARSTSETVAWTQAGTSGTLTVSDGGKTASLTLVGAYSASDFKLSNDGHGGTYVSDSAAAGGTGPLVEAAARMPAGRAWVQPPTAHLTDGQPALSPQASPLSGR